MTKKEQYTIVIWKEGDRYVSRCLNFEVSSYGDTYEEALANINEAIELYLEDLKPNEFSEYVSEVSMPAMVLSDVSVEYKPEPDDA